MTVELVSAGNPPAVRQGRDGRVEVVDLTGDVLWMFDDVRFETRRIPVEPGERLFLFSDGLIEAYPDSQGKSGSRGYGYSCLIERLASQSGVPLQEAVTTTVGSLIEQLEGVIDDDVVLLGVEF